MNNATSTANPPGSDFQLKKYIGMVGASLGQLHNHPVLAWITPQLPVRLIEADGSQSLWVGGRKQQATQTALQSARFTAVELPADLALSRSLVLPPLSERDLRDALALDVRDSNPFDPSELVWGYRRAVGPAGQLKVATALASRRQVIQHLQVAAPELADSAALEVWVLADEGAPVVLQGFGEAARARRAARGRLLAFVLITTAVMLATAMAVTPTMQLRIRTLQAVDAYRALQQRAAPAVAQREALVRGREDLSNLQEVVNDHVEPLVAIEMLTQLIPDDTWLQRVQIQGTRFTLSGQTPNAAALMNSLSGNPGLRDVRAPAPATRVPGSTRESFVVEFTAALNLLRRPVAAAGQAPVAAVPVPVPATVAQPAASAATRLQP